MKQPPISSSFEDQVSHTHPLKQACKQFLSRHQPISSKASLEKMTRSKYADYQMDFYGEGKLIKELEERLADLLGKQKALFCHKGMAGQLSAIKHWAELKQNKRIAFQPRCHMHVDEQSACAKLLNLDINLVGSDQYPITIEDLTQNNQLQQHPVSVLSIEIPHRRAGFLLPQWQTLESIKAWCENSGTMLHFDGARLFEAAPHWKKSPAEVANLSDSVYVSLYKMFGALAGGVVAADEETIESIKPWKSRMAGDVHTLFPYAISAMMGLDEYLPRITEFRERAIHISKLITCVLGEACVPHPVQSNSFVVTLPRSANEANKTALAIAKNEHKWLFDSITSTANAQCTVEIQIGDASNFWGDDEICACFEKFSPR